MDNKSNNVFMPITPGGTICVWLESKTEIEAWDKLLKDVAHMPYKTKQEFIERGYTVEEFPEMVIEDDK